MRRSQLRAALIFVHRWLGVALCLLFLLWFTSAFAMMYCEYPLVTGADRIRHAPPLDPFAIRLSPQEAYARLQTDSPPCSVRIETLAGRPVYRFAGEEGEAVVYADDGQVPNQYPLDLTSRIAAAWTGQSGATARIEQIAEPDQWTVSGELADLRPMVKYTWPNGEQVYVSKVNGQVAQYTTRASRLGAYLGPIPHWLYFTPLRKRPQTWSWMVIYASGFGAIGALFGLVIAVTGYSPSKRFRRDGTPSHLPYSGQKRWHAVLGLFFGLFACSWAFSGMLSMDPFPRQQGDLDSPGDATATRLSSALRGYVRLADFATKLPQEAILQLSQEFPVKELELVSFAGEPVYLAFGDSNQSRVIPLVGSVARQFDRAKIIAELRKAAQPSVLAEAREITEYESYYVDRHNRLPLPAIVVRLNDAQRSIYYVDPGTARIVQSFTSANSRWNRWLYHGLHSLDLPWLYYHRPAWDVLVLVLLLGGESLCVTSVILAWKVLRR